MPHERITNLRFARESGSRANVGFEELLSRESGAHQVWKAEYDKTEKRYWVFAETGHVTMYILLVEQPDGRWLVRDVADAGQ